MDPFQQQGNQWKWWIPRLKSFMILIKQNVQRVFSCGSGTSKCGYFGLLQTDDSFDSWVFACKYWIIIYYRHMIVMQEQINVYLVWFQLHRVKHFLLWQRKKRNHSSVILWSLDSFFLIFKFYLFILWSLDSTIRNAKILEQNNLLKFAFQNVFMKIVWTHS